MKGFKKDGKFIPTEKKSKSTLKKTDVKRKTVVRNKKSGDSSKRFKQIPIYKYDDAPKELQQDILEHWRNTYSGSDNSYIDFDGQIYNEKLHIDGGDFLSQPDTISLRPEFWNFGNGNNWVQYPNLEVTDNKIFAKALGIDEDSLKAVMPRFENDGNRNTSLEFSDVNGNKIDMEIYEDETELVIPNENYIQPTKAGDDGTENFWLVEPEDTPTKKEWKQMLKARENWESMMKGAIKHIESMYESEFEDENIIETIRANDYDFNESGEIESS
jgi:hypothetical protein